MSQASEAELRELYRTARTIAVVGCSSHWPKPSCVVPAYMEAQGYRVMPVNPHEAEVLGESSSQSLRDITEPVDIVDVFRPAEEAPAIAMDAVRVRARCLWLQTGIISAEAEQIATEAGMLFVSDACIGITHGNLGFGEGVRAYRERTDAAMVHDLRRPSDLARDHWRGGREAAVEIVDYGDYQCPFSRRTFRAIQRFEEELGDDLRYVYRHFPRPKKHPLSEGVARFVEAAGLQDRFWEAHEFVFHHQKALDHRSLMTYASELGLDIDRVRADEMGSEVCERVARDVEWALSNGLTGTPSVFVNGTRYHGDSVYEQLAVVVLGALARPAAPA